MSRIVSVVLWSLIAAAWSVPAVAQPLGTFTWTLAPFCNRLALNVTQAGAIFTLAGYDDLCGAAQRAAVTGTGVANPDGTIGFGLQIVTTPAGTPVHVSVRLSLTTVQGPWNDSAGNAGTLTLAANPAGAPRPTPNGLGLGGLNVAGSGVVSGSLTAGAISAAGAATFGSLNVAGNGVVSGSLTAGSVSTLGAGTFGSLTTSGEITRPATGALNNLVPIAYVSVQANGSNGGGTSNVTTAWEPVDAHYVVNIGAGTSGTIPLVTALAGNSSAARSATVINGSPTSYWVYLWNASGVKVAGSFYLVAFRP